MNRCKIQHEFLFSDNLHERFKLDFLSFFLVIEYYSTSSLFMRKQYVRIGCVRSHRIRRGVNEGIDVFFFLKLL